MTDTPTPTPAPMKAPALPYSFKANLTEYRKRIGTWRVVLAFFLTLIFWVRFGFEVWAMSVIGLALLLGAILYVMASRRLTIQPDSIVYRGAFGRVRTTRFDEIEGVKVFIHYYEPSFGTTPRVVIAKKSGSPLGLSGLYWSVDELDKLLAVLADNKVTTEYYEDLVSYTAIAQQFPNYATLLERRPGVIAAIVLVVLLVIVVGVAVWLTLG